MTSIFVFISGAALLIYSAEKLIGYLVGVASGLRISIFLLAIVFTGIEFDDITLGVALNLEDLGNVALGIVFGTAIAFTGIVLALAAILTPVTVRIPRDYLIIFAAAPLVMVVFTLIAPLTTVDGIVLLGLFGLFLTYVAVRECSGNVPVFRDAEMYETYALARATRAETAVSESRRATGVAEPAATGPGGEGTQEFSADMPFARARERSGWTGLGLAVLALAGLLIGGATTGIGTEGILHAYGLEGTVFGATIATLVLTIEDVFLTVEPTRKGAPEVGVGNVIGSLVFSVTGKLGVTLLAGGIVVGPDVLTWHLPALIVLTGLAAYFLSTGRLRRWHGFTLLGLYVVYWAVTFVVFGVAPVDL
ncbi:MAG: sodium:calcium antiporter [Streptosporangiales bacterium]